MFVTLWQRLDQSARLIVPFAITLTFVLASVVIWPLPYFGPVAPWLAVIAVYYWTLHRPDLFRPWMAFAIGLLNDIVNFLPPGLSALIFVIAHQLILRQRRFFIGHSFFMLWIGFVLTGLLVMLAEWIGISLIHVQWTPFGPVLLQMLLAIIIFPLPCWFLIRLQRAVLSQG